MLTHFFLKKVFLNDLGGQTKLAFRNRSSGKVLIKDFKAQKLLDSLSVRSLCPHFK